MNRKMRKSLSVRAKPEPEATPESLKKLAKKTGRHLFQKGHDPRRAGGRPKGAKNRFSKEYLDHIAKKQAEGSPTTPLDYMIHMLVNGTKKEKMWAAEKAAPYIHRKMPTAIEGGDKPIGFFDTTQLAKLSTPDLRKMLELMKTIGVMSETAETASELADPDRED